MPASTFVQRVGWLVRQHGEPPGSVTLVVLMPGEDAAGPGTEGAAVRGGLPTHLDVPWLLLAALVVLVPALAAGVAALTARGPLPGRARTAVG